MTAGAVVSRVTVLSVEVEAELLLFAASWAPGPRAWSIVDAASAHWGHRLDPPPETQDAGCAGLTWPDVAIRSAVFGDGS